VPSKQQYLVAGTAAGTLSADFDTSASLELLPVALHGGAAPGGVIGQPLGRVQAPARFTGECKLQLVFESRERERERARAHREPERERETKKKKPVFFVDFFC
jgi:hypothetical protein